MQKQVLSSWFIDLWKLEVSWFNRKKWKRSNHFQCHAERMEGACNHPTWFAFYPTKLLILVLLQLLTGSFLYEDEKYSAFNFYLVKILNNQLGANSSSRPSVIVAFSNSKLFVIFINNCTWFIGNFRSLASKTFHNWD